MAAAAGGRPMSLRVGLIDYVNIFPLTHAFEQAWPTPLHRAAPSTLNRLLAEGRLDTSPISSIEYARHQRDYLLLPDISISSGGAVQSVVLFSRVPLPELDGAAVGICAATATSRVLLRIVLEDHVGISPRYVENATIEGAQRGDWPAVLLIGDEALAFRAATEREGAAGPYRSHDLGAMWTARTGLPMVFAVWAVRREAATDEAVERLVRALHVSRAVGRTLPPDLLTRAAVRTELSHAALREYYGRLHFTLGDAEAQALRTFYALAAAKGLCPACERLEYALPTPALASHTAADTCAGQPCTGGPS